MQHTVGVKERTEQTEHVTVELLHALALSMTAARLSANHVFGSSCRVFQNAFALTRTIPGRMV